MDDRITRTIRGIKTLEDLRQFEENARVRNALTEEIKEAIRAQTTALGRALVAEKTGLDLTFLTPAEEKIVEAVGEYAGIKKREGTNATRTLLQLRHRGLIGAAEESVAKSKPTQGFTALADADLEDLSYEQIVVDHPEEFSARAQWYARRTLGRPTDGEKPPAKGDSLTQTRTETLLAWLREQAAANHGRLPPFRNADSAAALGMADLHRYGRVLGNIQSRIDYACYVAGLPPLGLAGAAPFDDAWQRPDGDWVYPISSMQTAAQSHTWSTADFDRVLQESRKLSGLAHIVWQKEVAANEAGVKAWAFGLQREQPGILSEDKPDARDSHRNPPWSRNELILALDLYLRFRRALPGKESPEVAELSTFLGKMGRASGMTEDVTYRNANGVYMKMMNFRRFDSDYTVEGKVGLTRGNKEEESIWAEFANEPSRLAAAVAAIRAGVEAGTAAPLSRSSDAPASQAQTAYWVFACNPKKWAIDRFLDRRVEHDTWGVRPSDRERFGPGQLGIVRVGVDRRSAAERNGSPPLEPGIYAVCEIESVAFDATGASDEFWAPGEAREPGWPTVKLRYLRTFLDGPLTIARLRAEVPDISPLLLNGFQAASFPIAANDFHRVMALLDIEPDELVSAGEHDDIAGEKLAAMEQKYLHACPETKERLSRTIERGQIGALVKRAMGFKCQVCEALGRNPVGFLKKSGEPYVEAHHVMPVSKREVGSLAAANVMTVCANHHRQMHYGNIDVAVTSESFQFTIDGTPVKIPRLSLAPAQAVADAESELV
jgi:predicted HNH restriction endonuclease